MLESLDPKIRRKLYLDQYTNHTLFVILYSVMKNIRRIVICGASIYMLAIENGLTAMSEGEIVRINPYLPNTLEHINVLEPKVVIVERNRKNNQLALELLQQGFPLIVLDEAQCAITVLGRERISKSEISALTCVIEKIIRQQDVPCTGNAIIEAGYQSADV